jgi:hypothetical protein
MTHNDQPYHFLHSILHVWFMLLLKATCSVDGVVRIYEAADIMNLNVWNLAYEIQCQVPACCISWSTSRYVKFCEKVLEVFKFTDRHASGDVRVISCCSNVNGRFVNAADSI